MELVHKAEKALEGPLKAVPPLPKDAKKGLASILPWLALAFGILQLLAAWWLYDWARDADKFVQWANDWLRATGADTVNAGLTVWVWIAVAVLVVDAVILLLAFPRLQKKQKGGWDLLLLGSLINLVYGVVSLFIDGRGGIGSLIWTLIASFIGFYLLFQVREFFGGKRLESSAGSSEKKEDK